jgi:hypothetical protein
MNRFYKLGGEQDIEFVRDYSTGYTRLTTRSCSYAAAVNDVVVSREYFTRTHRQTTYRLPDSKVVKRKGIRH